MKGTTPTMKDVAREAGVALGTVSKVFNDIPVGEDYRKRVEEAARRLGGTPENTVIFEDILVAARTAKQAGFSLGVIYDANSDAEQEQLRALADCYFTRWDDPALTAWLGV